MIRWNIAERFGWTLAEVDALRLSDLHELLQIDDGKTRAQEAAQKAARHRGAARFLPADEG